MTRSAPPNVTAPPVGWRRYFAFGPGLIWSVSAVGLGELIFATRAGAMYGLALLWVPFVAILLKFFITELMGRYTIATGKNVITAFGRIELTAGPLRLPEGWTVWLFWFFFIVSVAGISGIALALGSCLQSLLPVFPVLIWSLLSLLSLGIALFAGNYRILDRVGRILIGGILFFAIFAVFKTSPPAADIVAGMVPRIHIVRLGEMVPLLGWSGAGAMGTVLFSLWTRASGRGVPAGSGTPSPEDTPRIREWIKVNRTDLAVNSVFTALLTAGFLIAGAGILKPAGMVPGGEDTGAALSRIAGAFFGRTGEIIFLIAVCGTLYGIMAAHIDGLCRVATTTLGYRSADRDVKRITYRFFLVTYMLLSGLMAALIPVPIILLQITAITDALLLPAVAFMGVYICTRFLPEAFRPGRTAVMMAYIAAGFFLFFVLLLFGKLIAGR